MRPVLALAFVCVVAAVCAASTWWYDAKAWLIDAPGLGGLNKGLPAPTGPPPCATVALRRGRGRKRGREPEFRHQRRVHRLVVHSNKSTTRLAPFRVNNVVAINIVRASIPRAHYVIDRHNCTLDVRSPAETGDVVTVSMVPGDMYDATTLAEALQDALCCCTGMSGFSVKFMQHNSTYRFTHVGSFELLFASGPTAATSLFRELGFPGNVDAMASTGGGTPDGACDGSGDGYSCVSPFRSDLTGARYVHVHVPQLNKVHPDKGFLAQIPLLPPHPFGVFEPHHRSGTERTFPNIFLKSLDVRLVEIDPASKRMVDYILNGMYFSLTIEVVTLERTPTWRHALVPPLNNNVLSVY